MIVHRVVFRGWPPESHRVVEELSAANITAEVMETVVAGQGIAIVVSEIVVSDLDFAARRLLARTIQVHRLRVIRVPEHQTRKSQRSVLAEDRVNLRLRFSWTSVFGDLCLAHCNKAT